MNILNKRVKCVNCKFFSDQAKLINKELVRRILHAERSLKRRVVELIENHLNGRHNPKVIEALENILRALENLE